MPSLESPIGLTSSVSFVGNKSLSQVCSATKNDHKRQVSISKRHKLLEILKKTENNRVNSTDPSPGSQYYLFKNLSEATFITKYMMPKVTDNSAAMKKTDFLCSKGLTSTYSPEWRNVPSDNVPHSCKKEWQAARYKKMKEAINRRAASW